MQVGEVSDIVWGKKKNSFSEQILKIKIKIKQKQQRTLRRRNVISSSPSVGNKVEFVIKPLEKLDIAFEKPVLKRLKSFISEMFVGRFH